jgi:hypothetical protein
MKKVDFALRLRQTIKKMYDASRLLSECQFHMAACADEIDRLNKEIRKEEKTMKTTNKEDLVGKFTVIVRNGSLRAVKVQTLTRLPEDGVEITYELLPDHTGPFKTTFFSPTVRVCETEEEAFEEIKRFGKP